MSLANLTFEEYRNYYITKSVDYPYLDDFGPNGPHYHRTTFYTRYIKPEMKVLDVGCSNGGLAKYLTEHIGCTVIASDIAPFFVANAQINAPKAICLTSSIEELPFAQNSFDAIIAGEVLEHVQNIDLALSVLVKLLKKGGILLATTPRDMDNNEQHINYLDGETWLKLLPTCEPYLTPYSWLVYYKKNE